MEKTTVCVFFGYILALKWTFINSNLWGMRAHIWKTWSVLLCSKSLYFHNFHYTYTVLNKKRVYRDLLSCNPQTKNVNTILYSVLFSQYFSTISNCQERIYFIHIWYFLDQLLLLGINNYRQTVLEFLIICMIAFFKHWIPLANCLVHSLFCSRFCIHFLRSYFHGYYN